MRPIAILPRNGREIVLELQDSLMCLGTAGINACNAVIGQAFALVWVDDENTVISVEALRDAGLQATAISETEDHN